MRGAFITFEGMDASGKSTQADLLAKHLTDKGIGCVVTREPGGTAAGEKIRELLLSESGININGITEVLLFAAARAQLAADVIEPSLEKGLVVICDRFYDSSVAYQGSGRNMGDVVTAVNERALMGLKPDLTFLLSGDPSRLRARRNPDEEDRLDSESEDFQRRVAEGYMKIAESEPERVKVIDAELSVDDISERVFRETDEILSKMGMAGVKQ